MCLKKLKIKLKIIIGKIFKLILKIIEKIFGKFFANCKRIYEITITRIKKIIDGENEKEYEYECLSPDSTITRESFDALEYAFLNKNISNIAITGNYSSGKSSIIESFIDKNFCFKKKIFTLSLAILSDKNKDYDPKEIEKSIIEQLYYSNLVKLRNMEKMFFQCLAILSAIFLFDILYIFLLSKFDFIMQIDKYIRFGLYIIFIILMSFFMYKVLSIIQSCNRVSITAPNIEIDIKNEDEDSNIINKELGLIQKIINTIGIKYIIFEDLDRFNKSIIFDHLRELNIILNNQKNKMLINSKIKFIYLIRDDVFKDENRTKFFDFIYPVIPYVSYGTSGEELNKLIKKYNLQEELYESYILDICLYIDDFRILKNTLNEYRIYKKDLNRDNLNYKELFSILLYKNLFSEDFSKLQRQDGDLYKQLISIEDDKKLIIKDTENKIIKLEEEILNLKMYKTNDTQILEEIWNAIILHVENFNNIVKLKNKERQYDFRKCVFEKIKDEIPLYFFMNNETEIWYYDKKNVLIKINLKEMLSNSKSILNIIKKYEEDVEKAIHIKNQQITLYKRKVKDLKEKGNRYYFYYKSNSLLKYSSENKKEQLIQYLILHDYINKNYEIYISKFHSGSLSKNDAEYVTSLKIGKEIEYSYKIDNPQKVLEIIGEEEFGNKSILNVYLLKELINKENRYKIDKICELFHRWSKLIEFFAYILENYSEEEQDFFFDIYVKRNDFWLNFSYEANEYIHETTRILERLLLKLKKEDLPNIYDIEDLYEFIENNNLLVNNSKYCEIIKILKIQYNDLNSDIFDFNVRNVCIENGCFEININNFKYIFSKYLKLSLDQFNFKNFSVICKIKSLENYIKKHIDVYLKNIYFELAKTKVGYENSEKDVLYLLNHPKVNISEKEKILEIENVTFRDIKDIQVSKVKTLSLQKNKIVSSWSNVINYFNNKKKIDNDLIEFINNHKELSQMKEEFKQHENNMKFCTSIYKCYDIDNSIYEFVVSYSNIKLNLKNLKEIPKEKLKILIENSKLDINIEEYRELKNNYGIDLCLLYIENNTSIIESKFFGKYEYSLDELNLILKDCMIEKDFKVKLLINRKNFSLENATKASLLKFIQQIIRQNINAELISSDIEFIFKNLSDKMKLNFLNFYLIHFSNQEIIDIITEYLPQYLPLVKRNQAIYSYSERIILLISKLKFIGFKIDYRFDDNKILVNTTIKSLL